jgi:hypothetical protein
VGERQSLRGGDADEERTDQPRPRGDGDRVDVGEPHPRLDQCPVHRGEQRVEVSAGCDLGDHAAVGSVELDL